MAIDTIVIGCMDRRLNGFIDENYANDHTYVLRNAGANVHTLEESIRQIVENEPIKRIVLLPHTSHSVDGIREGDCGAMKFTWAAIKDGMKVSGAVEEGLIEQFRGREFGSIHELERVNGNAQVTALTKLLQEELGKPRDAANPHQTTSMPIIDLKGVDTSKLAVADDKDHALVLARPSTLTYEHTFERIRAAGHDIGMGSTYVIQATSIGIVTPDIEIAALALHLDGHSHKMVAFMTGIEKAAMEKDLEVLRRQTFFVHHPLISEVELVTKKGRVAKGHMA